MLKPGHKPKTEYKKKKLIVFDLDGTLTESKMSMDSEMVLLFGQLLQSRKIAVIGGGKHFFFKKNLLAPLKDSKSLFKNLFLFPTTATSFYRYGNGWKKVYSKKLSKAEKNMIKKAFADVFKEINYKRPEKIYGKDIEDRGTQISWSALGQDIVAVLGEKGVRLKKEWRDKNQKLKLKLVDEVQKRLPNLEVRAAGYTTIDVTRKGIDKEYGIRQIQKCLKIPLKAMLFIGDALFPGGNDSAVLRTGIPCIEVKGPEDTKKLIRFFIS